MDVTETPSVMALTSIQMTELAAAVSRFGQALRALGVAAGLFPTLDEIAHQQRLERHMARCARRRLRRKNRRR